MPESDENKSKDKAANKLLDSRMESERMPESYRPSRLSSITRDSPAMGVLQNNAALPLCVAKWPARKNTMKDIIIVLAVLGLFFSVLAVAAIGVWALQIWEAVKEASKLRKAIFRDKSNSEPVHAVALKSRPDNEIFGPIVTPSKVR